jgi:hypothetical protein
MTVANWLWARKLSSFQDGQDEAWRSRFVLILPFRLLQILRILSKFFTPRTGILDLFFGRTRSDQVELAEPHCGCKLFIVNLLHTNCREFEQMRPV